MGTILIPTSALVWQISPPLKFSWRSQAGSFTPCLRTSSCVFRGTEVQLLIIPGREGNPQQSLAPYSQKQRCGCCGCLLAKGQPWTPSQSHQGIAGVSVWRKRKNQRMNSGVGCSKKPCNPPCCQKTPKRPEGKHKAHLHCDVRIVCSSQHTPAL